MVPVVQQVVAQAVDVTNFVTACDASKEAFKTATLLKTLTLSSLIRGQVGVGKKTLARYILPDAPLVSALNHNEVLLSLEKSKEVIVVDLEKSPNIKKLTDSAKQNNVRIIATADSAFDNEFFSIKFSIPPLLERKEDVDVLIDKFVSEASSLFGSNKKFSIKNFKPDLTKNSSSLRRQIMVEYLLQDINDTELMNIMQNYLNDKLGSNSDYKKFLYLYEAPLIKAGLCRYKSQLQLSERLGLNRNTLRKKIADNKNYL